MNRSLAVLSNVGTTTIIWNPRIRKEVSAARSTFEACLRKGYQAYSVTNGGGAGELISEFPSRGSTIILMAPLGILTDPSPKRRKKQSSKSHSRS